MLLSFRAANHRSLRDEQQLLMAPGDMDIPDFPPPKEMSPLPVAGIFGPNASGKSNVVEALQFMRRLVLGFPGGRARGRETEPDEGIDRWPFALDDDSPEHPSVYVVDLLIGGERYTYGFSIDAESVLEEWLYRYSNEGTEEIVFERQGTRISGGARDGLFDVTKYIEVESDVLLMRIFSSVQPKLFDPDVLDSLRRVSDWFRRGLWIRRSLGPVRGAGRAALHNGDPKTLDRLADLLAAADTGIGRISVETRRIPDGEEEREVGRWVFHHRTLRAERTLGIEDQSRGTQALLELGIQAMNVLDRGRTLVIDELDASLHTLLSARLIELFRDPEANPYGAQLIFTSHDAALLGRIRGREVLRGDQIWFTEKNEEGATELYPLSGYSEEEEGNRGRKYLTGRYGAVPFIDDDMFAAALAARESDPGE